MEPRPHPLLASELRVERAYRHMLELREELLAYIDAHKGLLDLTHGPEGGLVVERVGEPPPFPLMVGVMIGEVVYNLRSALDYLVYTLAVFGSGGKDVDGTQFPIEDDPKVFEGRWTGTDPDSGKKVWQTLKGVQQAHVDLIEKLQPYHPEAEWTRTLRELSNPDKHRVLTPLVGKGAVNYLGPSEIRWEPGQEEQEVDIRYRVQLEVQLAKLDTPLLPTLKLLHDQVAATIDLFKGFFSPRPGV